MDADLVELLTQNLSRLDEGAESDRTGVYYILSKFIFPCVWPLALSAPSLTRFRCFGKPIVTVHTCGEDWTGCGRLVVDSITNSAEREPGLPEQAIRCGNPGHPVAVFI